MSLTYETHGPSGPSVVLVAPIGAPGAFWMPFQVPALTGAGYRVVTFESRGIPPSDVPAPPYSVAEMVQDLAGLIDYLDAAPTLVVGYSLGAFVTQELALARPDLVRGVVLLGTLGRKDATRKALADAALEAVRAGARMPPAYEAVTQALTLFGRTRLADDRWMEAFLKRSRETAVLPLSIGILGQQEASTAYDHRLRHLGAVRTPCLVVGFELDLLTPAALSREVADAIVGSRYVEIPDCGHGGPWEKPDDVNRAVLEFLSSV